MAAFPREMADRYQVDIVPASGPASTVLTPGTGTTVAGTLPAGTYRVRVVGLNACGSGRVSNEILVTV